MRFDELKPGDVLRHVIWTKLLLVVHEDPWKLLDLESGFVHVGDDPRSRLSSDWRVWRDP